MPSFGLRDRLARAIVLGDQAAGFDFTSDASRKTGLMLAGQVGRGWGRVREFLGVEVSTAGDAMDVRVLMTAARGRIQVFAFAFREPLFSLHVVAINPS